MRPLLLLPLLSAAFALGAATPQLIRDGQTQDTSWQARRLGGLENPDERDYIPKSFGRVISIRDNWKESGTGRAWVWLEAPDGTIRVVALTLEDRNFAWNVYKEIPRR